MKQKTIVMSCALFSFLILFTLSTVKLEAATTITSSQEGTYEGYDYKLIRNSDTTSMTLKDDGTFSCEWNKDLMYSSFGKKFDENLTHYELGNISMKYACDFQTDGRAYIGATGWTKDPLINYCIIENWSVWKPPGAMILTTIDVDGGTYEIFERNVYQGATIIGTASYRKYWSVRTTNRTNGTISISDHFKAWESIGMNVGKPYNLSFFVDGYYSSGKFDLTSMSIDIDKSITSTPVPSPTSIIVGDNKTGTFDGFDYELWTQSSNDSKMTINRGGSFSCEWTNSQNSLFLNGKRFGETKSYNEIGKISVNYEFDSPSNRDASKGIKGLMWMSENTWLEYFILDSWEENWIPKDAIFKGTIGIDGGTYDVYERQYFIHGISGTTYYKQYWSLRMSPRISGIVSVNEHFKAWESLGMKLGKIKDVSLFVEAYKSSGRANVTKLSIDIENYIPPTPTPTTVTPTPTPTPIETPTPIPVVITSDQTGTYGEYNYKLSKEDGTATMTLEYYRWFTCEWYNSKSSSFSLGKKFDGSKTYQEIGNIIANYSYENKIFSGYNYLGVYVGMRNSAKFYILDSWNILLDTESVQYKGSYLADGNKYNLYIKYSLNTTSSTEPPIYYCVPATGPSKSNTFIDKKISVSNHLKACELLGIKTDNIDEVSLVVDCFSNRGDIASSGKAEVIVLSIDIDDNNILASPYIYGDINGDDAVNLSDSVALAEYLLNKTDTLANMRLADVNSDGKIDVIDYLTIRRHFIEDIDSIKKENVVQ